MIPSVFNAFMLHLYCLSTFICEEVYYGVLPVHRERQVREVLQDQLEPLDSLGGLDQLEDRDRWERRASL